MTYTHPPLPEGYTPIPPGHVANVATFLEMKARPTTLAPMPSPDLSVRRWANPDLAAYRALFKAIGEKWLWQSRVVMPDDELLGIFRSPGTEVYRLFRGETVAGLLELDFSTPPHCELTFFGLTPEEIGKGAGRFLMNEAIRLAWTKPILRLWVHTCTFDHPSALSFYRRSGFTPYQVAVEIHPDPRVTGHMPRSAAPHVAIIES